MNIESVCAQSPLAKKDSLTLLLSRNLQSSQKVDVLNALAYEFFDVNDSIGFEYARLSVAEVSGIDYPIGAQYAYTMLGVGHFSFGEYQQALQAFRKSETYSKRGIVRQTTYNMMLKGNVLADIGLFDSAALEFDKALVLLKDTDNKRSIGSIYKAYARLKLYTWENEEALRLITLADEAWKKSSEESRLDLYTIYARIYINLNQFDRADSYITKLCSIVSTQEDNYHKAMCLLVRAESYLEQSQLTEALTECFKVLEVAKVYNYHLLRAQLFITIGQIYTQLSDYKLASDFFYRALRITERAGMDPLTAVVYSELAWIYKDQANYPLALEFADRSQASRAQMGDRRGVASCHNVRGLIYLLQRKYSTSIEEHTKALVIRQEIKYPEGISASLFNMSLAYEELGMLEKALELQLEAFAIDKTVGNKQGLAISYNGLASLYLKMGMFDEAEDCLVNVKILADQTKSRLLLKNYYQYAAELAEVRQNFKQASLFRKRQQQISDSLYSESNSMKLAEMQALYQVERKEQEIVLLSKERELRSNELEFQKDRIQNQNTIISIGASVLLVSILFIVSIIRMNKKVTKSKMLLAEANEELLSQAEELRESNETLIGLNMKLTEQQEEIQAQTEELQESNDTLVKVNEDLHEKREEVESQAEELRKANQTISSINQTLERKVEERTQQLTQAYVELDTFFYRSSHDFRRPITTFMGLAEVAQITVKDDKALELFSKVKETAQSLDKMIRKLQSISDVGAQELIFKEVLLREIIENILVSFKDEIDRKKVKLTHDVKLDHSFKSYPALVNVIVENLIENAIHFASPVNPFVKILVYTTNQKVIIEVEDNGQGIAEEYHDRIFDMYFRANVSSKGNGLGLYIVQKAVAKLNGNIRFMSELHSGTKFVVELPLTS